MSADPRFDVYPTEGQPKKRSAWTTCLIGCLIVFVVLALIGIVVGIYVAKNWKKWSADFGTQAANQMIDSSELPQEEKADIKAQVQRVGTSFRDGKISMEQMGKIFENLVESPLMPSLMVFGIEKQYFDKSALTDDEKAEGRLALSRFVRGVVDKKINQQGVDAVMAHVADRKGNNQWQMRQQVSDADLKAAIADAKAQADAAGVPDELEPVDPSDEVKRIIDDALGVPGEDPAADPVDPAAPPVDPAAPPVDTKDPAP